LKDSPKSFKNGDQVVLPPYGVGIVSGTTTKTVAGADHKYYEVQFPNGTSRAYVPVNAPLEAGLRPRPHR
jgi:CarD family transcriptional regulator